MRANEDDCRRKARYWAQLQFAPSPIDRHFRPGVSRRIKSAIGSGQTRRNLIPAQKMRIALNRRYLFIWLAVLLSCALGVSVAFLRAGIFLQSAAQSPAKADVIICLGGDWGERSKTAAKLYRLGFANQILLTGSLELSPIPGQPQLRSRLQVLVDEGIPLEAILLDQASGSSQEEATNSLKLIRDKGWQSALVVSDPPHMRRLARVWGRVFEGSGRHFRVIAAPMPNWVAETWWKNPWSREFVVKEYMKLVYSTFLD